MEKRLINLEFLKYLQGIVFEARGLDKHDKLIQKVVLIPWIRLIDLLVRCSARPGAANGDNGNRMSN